MIAALALVLASCATVPAPEVPKNESLTWDNRVQTLSNIENWDIKALIAVRNNKDAESATLRWQQDKQNFTIYLFGPLGSNSYTLTGKPGKVELTTHKGKKFSAIAKKFQFKKKFQIVTGGAERQDSVWNGLSALAPDTEIVAIQDGARPCPSAELIRATIAAAREACGELRG